MMGDFFLFVGMPFLIMNLTEDRATIGGVLLLVAVVISLWAGEFPSIGISNILHLLAGIFAFVAAPTVAAAAEA